MCGAGEVRVQHSDVLGAFTNRSPHQSSQQLPSSCLQSTLSSSIRVRLCGLQATVRVVSPKGKNFNLKPCSVLLPSELAGMKSPAHVKWDCLGPFWPGRVASADSQ